MRSTRVIHLPKCAGADSCTCDKPKRKGKDKKGAVLGVEMKPVPKGWHLFYIHRTGTGGIMPVTLTVKTLDKAIDHVRSTVALCGYEENKP